MHRARNGLQPLDAVHDGKPQPSGSPLGSGGMALAGAASNRATLPTGAEARRSNTRAILKMLSDTNPLNV